MIRADPTGRRDRRDPPRLLPLLLALAAVSLPVRAAGQEAPADSSGAPPCSGPEHRQFDFRPGDWTVRSPSGKVLGRNEIQAVAGGCGLRETWRGTDGSVGPSLNFRARIRWTPREDGTVRQLWEISRDGGESREALLEGIYHPARGSGDGRPPGAP